MDTEEVEIKVLLEAVKLRHGYDFSQYAEASFRRRVRKSLAETGLKNISEMIPLIIHDKKFFKSFLFQLSVNVTEMFRDPLFFLSLRELVIPYLRTFPYIKIWSAGVSTGEEVYSLAVLLKEEDLYDKCLIYATDFNDRVLEKAQKGIYSAENIKKSTANYQKAGGKKSFAAYYHADYDSVIMDRSLKENIVFANHNLVTDGVFGEMNLILCRNVLIYFNRKLQGRVLKLFYDSLRANGFLGLGSRESIEFSGVADAFVPVVKKRRIFQKKAASSRERKMKHDIQAVVVGVSAGGFKALHTILPLLREDFPAPVVVVQHRMEGEDDFLVESLGRKCRLVVKEAQDKEKIENGVIYIAPGGYHLLIEKEHSFSLSVDAPVCHARPSIDVLFETAADAYGARLVGIVLTGANSDGSDGVRSIKKAGGLTVAQDPQTAEVSFMPLSAVQTRCIDKVLTLGEIPVFLNELTEARHG